MKNKELCKKGCERILFYLYFIMIFSLSPPLPSPLVVLRSVMPLLGDAS